MSTGDLLREVEERGLRIVLIDGQPRLQGPASLMTKALLNVLRHHREEIIKRLQPKRLRQFLYRAGHVYRESGDEGGPEWFPAGAWWYRIEGETKWKVIPGAENVSVLGHRLFEGEGLPEGQQLDGEVPSP